MKNLFRKKMPAKNCEWMALCDGGGRRLGIKRSWEGQALLVVLLVGTICLIIVASLALRTARRISASRQAKEYQVAYGQALQGVEQAVSILNAGTAEVPFEYENIEADKGYSFSVALDEEALVPLPKDRSVDLWLPEGNDADEIEMSCNLMDPWDAGVLATLVFQDSSGDYRMEKLSLSCTTAGSWNFGGSCGALDCDRSEVISPVAGEELKLVRVKAFVETDATVPSNVLVLEDGDVIASTEGYRIDSTGFGYDDASSTISVIISPSGLPYPFDFTLFDGGE